MTCNDAPDRTAFAAQMLPHLDAAYNLARWLLRDPASAEDIVQEAMLRALTYFASFRGTNARAWLLQIVRSTAYTWLAAQRPNSGPEEMAEIPDPGRNPEESLAADAKVAMRHLGFIERGQINASIEVVGRIADALEVSPGKLFETPKAKR